MRAARVIGAVDNGGVPFVVELSSLPGPGRPGRPGRARVLKLRPGHEGGSLDKRARDRSYRLWRVFAYERAWVGCDDSVVPTRCSAVLLLLPDGLYVAIGEEVVAFRALPGDEVVGFIARMGNSAVSYPVAIGRANQYLTVARSFMRNTDVPDNGEDDPYQTFYAWRSARQESRRLPGLEVLHTRLE